MASAAPAMTRMTWFPAVSRFSVVEIRASSVSMPVDATDTRRPSTFTDVPGPMPAGMCSSTRPASGSTVALKPLRKTASRNDGGGAGEHGWAEINWDDLFDRGPGNDRECHRPHRLGMSGPDDSRRRARHAECCLRPGCRAVGKNAHRQQQDARPSSDIGHGYSLVRRRAALRDGIPYRRVVVVPPLGSGIRMDCS